MCHGRGAHVISGPWFVTPHAVRRYAERVLGCAQISERVFQRARSEIITDIQQARFVRTLESGADLYQGARRWVGTRQACVRYVIGASATGDICRAVVTVRFGGRGGHGANRKSPSSTG